MKKTAIYPGTFDPITYGHIDVIQKSLKIFENLIVAISDGSQKNYLFSIDERIQIVNKAKSKLPKQLEETSKKVVIGSLLNEGFENPGESINLSVEETSEEKELNNVLTSQVEDKKACVFTTNNQLLDIQTNEVGCMGNDMRISSSKEQLGPQGDIRPFGYKL